MVDELIVLLSELSKSNLLSGYGIVELGVCGRVLFSFFSLIAKMLPLKVQFCVLDAHVSFVIGVRLESMKEVLRATKSFRRASMFILQVENSESMSRSKGRIAGAANNVQARKNEDATITAQALVATRGRVSFKGDSLLFESCALERDSILETVEN